MSAARKLHVVAPEPEPEPEQEPPPDLTLAMRAEIAAVDWNAVHVRGDRNPPLDFFDRLKWTWRR